MGITWITVLTLIRGCVVISSKAHFGMAKELLNRWKGYELGYGLNSSPICFVVWCANANQQEVKAFLQSLPARDSLTIVLFSPPKDHAFSESIPENLLRNIGLRNSHTTYVVVMDSTILPSGI